MASFARLLLLSCHSVAVAIRPLLLLDRRSVAVTHPLLLLSRYCYSTLAQLLLLDRRSIAVTRSLLLLGRYFYTNLGHKTTFFLSYARARRPQLPQRYYSFFVCTLDVDYASHLTYIYMHHVAPMNLSLGTTLTSSRLAQSRQIYPLYLQKFIFQLLQLGFRRFSLHWILLAILSHLHPSHVEISPWFWPKC